MTEENKQEKEFEETDVVEEEAAEVSEETELNQQLEEAQDRYLRVQAELANIQKRNAKERQDAAKYRSQSLATELLPVIDNLERALEIEVDDEKAVNFKKGVEMVYNMMVEALKNEKIEAINPINEPFDPNFHMSIQVQEAEEGQEPDTVINVIQKGYKLNDRILRPAMVVVAQ
ncbi:Protein GrpE [Jeotgalibaca dankookensis]|uniref:Protein GrpE n=1 Tax=Jeotgalibaca dankookensis TaxID=708126 RepID=A0A1S6INH5_9LACT|nr:nucleotide exchange factor GrpE [Jeotgalibaca dankookensis]AQS53080.1 Protein GrpE [Jeotgalibaca dankookensis]